MYTVWYRASHAVPFCRWAHSLSRPQAEQIACQVRAAGYLATVSAEMRLR